MAQQARGLQNFISDLRNAKSKVRSLIRMQQEIAMVNLEIVPNGNMSTS
jgi:hypothetical protein